MKMKVLIGGFDQEYIDHLSKVMMKNGNDVTVSMDLESIYKNLERERYDIVLVESEFYPWVVKKTSVVTVLLSDYLPGDRGEEEIENKLGDMPSSKMKRIRKYQRISKICSTCLEILSENGWKAPALSGEGARTVAVWSPKGGSGKTTVALSYATKMATKGTSLYFSLEEFASTSAFFSETGTSISKAFAKIGGDLGNLATFLQAIMLRDATTGVSYFSPQDTYEDILELGENDVATLVRAMERVANHLVIDLSSDVSVRSRSVMNLVDELWIVADESEMTRVKLHQFMNQGELYPKYAHKIKFILNKGVRKESYAAMVEKHPCLALPYIPENANTKTFHSLSASDFGGVHGV